jgi:NADH dehydrogenase
MILIVGATGSLGGGIAHMLLAQGRPVRVLLRHNSPSDALAAQGMGTTAASLLAAGAQPVYGDLKDRASLDAAVAGVETVVSTANSALRSGGDTPETVDLQGNRNLIDAAKAAGVNHFIFVSVLAYDPNSPAPFMAAKAKTEDHLVASGLHYTILAPDIFSEVWIGMVIGSALQSGQPISLVRPATHRHSYISAADVAAYAVAAVDNPLAMDKRLPLGGPAALSWLDVVRKAEEVLGREFTVNLVEPGGPLPLLPPAVHPILAAGETYESVLDMSQLSETFSVPLTPVEDVMRRMFMG